MYSILVLDDVEIGVIEYLRSKCTVSYMPTHSKEQILGVIESIDGLIYRDFSTTLDKDILSKAKNLKCIVRTGGGSGVIDFEVAKKKNIVVMAAEGCNAFTAAEFIFASMLILSRKIALGDKMFRAGTINRENLWGSELANKTLGIIGFGRIGKNLCKMANTFGMQVISYSPHITKDQEDEYHMKGVTLGKLFEQSDFVSIAFPRSKDFTGMINAEKITLMKKGVNIINATSMSLFNYEDVTKALKDGIIGGLVIDRPDFDPQKEKHPFMDFPNVLFVPAIGSHTHEGQFRCGKEAADQLLEYLENGTIKHQIKG